MITQPSGPGRGGADSFVAAAGGYLPGMGEERDRSEEDVFPAGERADYEDEPAGDEDTFPAGVESDEGQRPDDTLEEGQPGMLDEPPRAD